MTEELDVALLVHIPIVWASSDNPVQTWNPVHGRLRVNGVQSPCIEQLEKVLDVPSFTGELIRARTSAAAVQKRPKNST